MRVRVGFTPLEPVAARVGIVVDVLRATSTICQALASGVERVTCVGEVDDARALAGPHGGAALAGERGNVKIAGFDFGNSPHEFERPAPGVSRLVLTTTNGTRLLLAAAARCETVLVGSLLNLEALVAEAAEAAEATEVAVLCAGVEGGFAIDDAYVAGRICAALEGERDDAAVAAVRLAGAFDSALEGIGGGVSAGNLRAAGLAEDIPFCARVGVLDVVPRVVERGAGAVVVAA